MHVLLRRRLPRSRRPSALVLAFVAAVFGLLAAGCAVSAAPVQPIDQQRYEYSADGIIWGGTELIPWDEATVPAPGGQPNSTSFYVRVAGTAAAKGELYLGNWSVDRGSAWFGVDVDGVPGERVTLPRSNAGKGLSVRAFSIPSGAAVRLTLNVGIPFGEVAQSARITPDWGLFLGQSVEPGNGSGSLGSGSLGSTGSTGGSSSGLSGSGSLGSLGSPSVGGR